jgi:H+/Cl- antiporter ClcA
VSSPADAYALLRSRRYVVLLIFAALLGLPVAAIAYWFLVLVSELQKWTYQNLPKAIGFHGTPSWWAIPVIAVGGLVVATAIRYLPGTGGESPAEGFKPAGVVTPDLVPGIAVAAIVTLASGAVLGPEAPLIALGGGLAVSAVKLSRRDLPAQSLGVIAATGSFAAISTLLGSPLIGAFLLMEASGLGGAMLGLVLLPGLLAAGVGTFIFVGLDSWTGHGTFTLALPNLPPFDRPNIGEFGWAIVVGLLAPLLGGAIRTLALLIRPHVERRMILLTPVVGALVGAFALLYAEVTGKTINEVLFSGQDGLGPLVSNSATYTVGALLMLLMCKSFAYGLSLSSLRGGPVFPAIFIGAAIGVVMSHLPGLPLVAGIAMGIGAMSVTMLRLPLTSVMLATLLLESDGPAVMPLAIVSVVVAYVVAAQLPFGQPPSLGLPARQRANHRAAQSESSAAGDAQPDAVR